MEEQSSKKMPIPSIKKEMNDGMYYLTLTVKDWYYLFDRYNRWEILEDSLIYCQKQKSLQIFAYVFMLNHIHLIVKSPDVSGFLRDFKKFTAQELMKNIIANEPSIASFFRDEKEKCSIWKQGNMPVLIESLSVFEQKKNYIEYNPVKKGYVELPEHWKRSSAYEKGKIRVSNIEEV